MSLMKRSKIGHGGKFAVGDQLFPRIGPQVGIDDFMSVFKQLQMTTVANDFIPVPLPAGCYPFGVGGNQVVQIAGPAFQDEATWTAAEVNNLHLRAGIPGFAISSRFIYKKHHTAVAAGRY